jgi:hypothetical protein
MQAGLPAAYSRVELRVNNAGLASGLEPAHETSVEPWEEMLDTRRYSVARAAGSASVDRGAVGAAGHGAVLDPGHIAQHVHEGDSADHQQQHEHQHQGGAPSVRELLAAVVGVIRLVRAVLEHQQAGSSSSLVAHVRDGAAPTDFTRMRGKQSPAALRWRGKSAGLRIKERERRRGDSMRAVLQSRAVYWIIVSLTSGLLLWGWSVALTNLIHGTTVVA